MMREKERRREDVKVRKCTKKKEKKIKREGEGEE